MSSQAKTLRSKRLVPSLQRADAAGIFIESFTLLNASQPGELGMQGMVGRQKKLFAVQDRRIAVAAVVSEPDLKGLQVNGHGRVERRMGIGLKVGVTEIGDLWLDAVQLDDICAIDTPDIALCTTFE